MTYSAGWAHGCRSLCRRGESGGGSRCQPCSRACTSCAPSGPPPPPEVGVPKRRAALPRRRKPSERRSEGKKEGSFFPKKETLANPLLACFWLQRSAHQKACALTQTCAAPAHYPGCTSCGGPSGTGVFITPMISLLGACLSSEGSCFIQILSPSRHSCCSRRPQQRGVKAARRTAHISQGILRARTH